MCGERSARCFAIPGNDIDHSVREAGLLNELSQPQAGQRRLLGWFHDDRASGGQRRPELPGGHEQRKIPRNDLAHDADGLTQRVGEELGARGVRHRDRYRVAFDLGGPPGHVPKQVDCQRDVGRAGDRHGLAVVERFKLCELFQMLVEQVGQLPNQPATL